ncbi:hypothetical protein FisN_4Hh558 [Fistulifera solaris]|uniref:NAD(P)-binding domain-containing protein n=1 Tax=Fistulifera solaris TaxID=1519565 RepID=A0A1Z5K5K9_FISSO|nr:hypothetical protein FisN_4Hh558 [Fistulifera solaris]|eukprot:GAX21496.1 hypothetical protein FisN_4Hh558 [Fistulifera solaris]
MKLVHVFALLIAITNTESFSFNAFPFLSTVATAAPTTPVVDTNPFVPKELKSVVKSVAVAGATGRTGQVVVQTLLNEGVSQVVAVVRDEEKARQVLPVSSPQLKIVKADFGTSFEQVLEGVDATIWSLSKNKNNDGLPKLVVCSSAGVTRPTWSDDKKKRLVGAADIPIVRLNPFGILDVKRESEERLREACNECNVPYTIVRPAGLNDDWPAGSRPIFSQGDVAVGRINRKDVARILVDALTTPSAVGKTFEVVAVAGYPPATTMETALSRLRTDQEGPPSDEIINAVYHTMQQLLPGEKQNSAGLAMGQTYEQMDQGKTGRLGERGQEDAASAAPKPTS